MARGLNVFVNIGGKLLPSLNEAAGAVERRFGLMTKRVRLQAAEAKATWKGLNSAASPLLTMAAAGGLMFSAKAAIGDSAQLSHQLQMLRNAGRTTQELAESMKAANQTIRDIPTSTLIDNIRVLNETTMAFGNFKHASENLSFVQKMSGMLSNALGDDHGLNKEAAYSLIKGLEMRGMGTKGHPGFDSGRFQHEAGLLYQASMASGGKVTPEEFFNFAKKSSPFLQGFSERYLYRIAPTLIQEQGGEIAGTQNASWLGTILGKAKNKISTEAWMKLGLLDPKQVVYNKVGPVGWRPGAIKGTDLAMQDPLAWSEKVLIPALKKQGIDTTNILSIQKALMPLFRDRNAGRLATMLVSQQTNANLHKDERLINKVPSLNAAYLDTLRNDPTQAWTAAKSSVNNMLSTMFLGTPGNKVNVVAVALVNVAKGVNAIASAFQSHPLLGKGVGALLLGSAGVAGLKVLGMGLGWALSPLKWLLFTGGPRKIGIIGWLLRGVSSGLRFLGPLVLRGLVALAPIVGEGLAAAFALLSNPIGWAILLGGIVIGLTYYFRGPLLKAWKTGWAALKTWVLSIDWKGVALGIGDALTFGLASKFAGLASRLTGGGKAPAVAGKRASGGPVHAGGLYLVGEKGPELWRAPGNGHIIPNHHINAMRRRGANPFNRASLGPVTIHVHGAHDPVAVAHEVKRQLNGLVNGQAALLSD